MTPARELATLAAMLGAKAVAGSLAPHARPRQLVTVTLAPDAHRLLARAARAAGVSRAELVRRQLEAVLKRYRLQGKPRSAAG